MKRTTLFFTLFLFLLTVAFVPATSVAEEDAAPYYSSRDEIPTQYTWDLSLIFKSRDDFEAAYKTLEESIPAMEEMKGTLGKSADNIAAALAMNFGLWEQFSELQVYASQTRDLDTRNNDANDMYLRVRGLAAKVSQATSFIDPEITTISDKKLTKFRKSEALAPWQHYIDNLVRLKPHIRNKEVEQLLAAAGPMSGAGFEAYSNLTTADAKWPEIVDEKGDTVTATPSLYYSFVSNQDRRIRKDASMAIFGTYTQYGNTFAATYNGQLQNDIFFTQARNYDRTLDRVLANSNVPSSVVNNLVETVHNNIELPQQYAELRKEILGIDEFHVYDLYVPLVAEAQRSFTFAQAKDLALSFWRETYGEEYAAIGERAFNERWVDVYANEGKRGGAYSWGTYNSVPYLLLNWGGTLEDVFTLVHEMGHSVHTYMANKNQPFQYSDYSLFVAEVASVASEALFFEWMLERTEDPTERLDLLNLHLNNITGTFLRQIFFHEFEDRAHKLAESGAAVTQESLGDIYEDLWKQYYGPELVLDPEYRAGWARVSHFYRSYYVWVYATSFSAGQAIAANFRSGNQEEAVQGYLDMLKLGGSVYPMDALKVAGVDMNDPNVIQSVMVDYKQTLDEMGKLLRARKAMMDEEKMDDGMMDE